MIQDIIYYGSFLVFPIAILLYLFRKKISHIILIFLGACMILFIYARFIEPQIIIQRDTEIAVGFEKTIILTSDLHLGRYKGEAFLKKVVNKINKIEADIVLIAGDLTYEPEVKELEKLFDEIGNINKTVYWVLGNHDVEKPGPKLREELISAMDKKNVHFLNNSIVDLGEYYLVGLGSHWNNEDDVSILSDISEDDNVITMMHNPDSLSKIFEKKSKLYLAGHTHGGQIRIPFLYRSVIPTVGKYDRGLTREDQGLLYVSAGLGETGLPMRFLNPPVIDVLHLK